MTLILFLFVILFLVFLITVAFIYIVRPKIFLIRFVSKGELIKDVDMWKAFIAGILAGILMICITVILIKKGYHFNDNDLYYFLNRWCLCEAMNVNPDGDLKDNSNVNSNVNSDANIPILCDKETNENKIVTHPVMKVHDEMGMM